MNATHIKIPQLHLQDLHHYALACQGKDNGFSACTLIARLECVDLSRRILTQILINSADLTDTELDFLSKNGNELCNEADLVQYGAILSEFTLKCCNAIGMDGATGLPAL